MPCTYDLLSPLRLIIAEDDTNCRSAGPLLKTCEADTGRFSIELSSINHPVAVSTYDLKNLARAKLYDLLRRFL